MATVATRASGGPTRHEPGENCPVGNRLACKRTSRVHVRNLKKCQLSKEERPLSDQEKLNEFADDLEAFRDGKIAGEIIREKYWAGGLPAQIGKVMKYVEHFLADEDIREKDAGYREMQEECLRELVYYLRKGVPAKELPIISFLKRPPRRRPE